MFGNSLTLARRSSGCHSIACNFHLTEVSHFGDSSKLLLFHDLTGKKNQIGIKPRLKAELNQDEAADSLTWFDLDLVQVKRSFYKST